MRYCGGCPRGLRVRCPNGASCQGVSSEVCEQGVDEATDLIRRTEPGPPPQIASIVVRAVQATCIDEHVTPLAEAVVTLVEPFDPIPFIVIEAANGQIISSGVICHRES